MAADARQLEKMADQLRAEGRLDEAAAAFNDLLTIEPDHLKASRIVSSITGQTSSLQSAPGGLKPAPFVVVREFLDSSVRDALHLGLLSKSRALVEAATTQGIHLDYRRSRILPDCFRYVDPAIEQHFYARFLNYWPQAQLRLRIAAFEPSFSETHALFYGDGDFFAPHNDTGPENTRRVTFVCNLQSTPRTFEGGDLILYDTYFRPGRITDGPEEPCFATTYTRIFPEDNRIVVFPSEFYHEVTPVTYRGTDPVGERISITGWVHTTREEGAPDRIAATPY